MKAFFEINGEHVKKNPGSYFPLRALTNDMLRAGDALHIRVKADVGPPAR
jgi:hypothetical protein